MSAGFSDRQSPISWGSESRNQPQGEGAAKRTPFPPDFPLVVVAAALPLKDVISSPPFVAGKNGDAVAAARLAKQYITNEVRERIRLSLRGHNPIVLTISSAINKVPFALADRIGFDFGLDIDENIYQLAGRRRSNASMFRRLWSRKKYGGLIVPGRSYIIVDDVLTQGGTLADLRGYVEGEGGKVVGAVVLTAGRGSHLLRISESTLRRLRERAGILEDVWQENFGFRFESLTNSEGRALVYFAFSLAKGYGGKPRKARKY